MASRFALRLTLERCGSCRHTVVDAAIRCACGAALCPYCGCYIGACATCATKDTEA